MTDIADTALPDFSEVIPSEYQLQVAVADYLKGELHNGKNVHHSPPPFYDLLFTHAYQGRSKAEGHFLKRMGLRPGVADLIFWWEVEPTILQMIIQFLGKLAGANFRIMHSGAIELKTKTEQSGVQEDFQFRFEKRGGFYAVCYTVEAVRDVLVSWRINCRDSSALVPRAVPSKKQQLKAYVNQVQQALADRKREKKERNHQRLADTNQLLHEKLERDEPQ